MLIYHQPEQLGGFRGPMCRSHSYATLQTLSAYPHQHDGNSDPDCENMKPMKRSRSDQSLNTTVQHLLAAGSSGGGGGGGGSSSSSGHHLYAVTPLRSCASEGAPVRGDAAPGGCSQRQPSRMPSLPVVLSDGSSSTNSLLSLESAEQLSATLLSVPAGEQQQQQQQQPGVLASSQVQRSISDVVYCLNVSSSAASLSQVTQQERQLGAAGTSRLSSCSDMTRTTSDASSASQGCASLLQQYSPPSLLPSGPVLDGGAAAQQQGPHRTGLSIQQQKQASFVKPQPPAAAAAAAGAGVSSSSSWGARPVAHGSTASLLSCDSVASAEAGEHLAGPLRYGQQQQQATSDSPGTSVTQRQPSQHQLPPLSPPMAGGSGSWARSTVRSTSCSGAVGGTAPSPVAAGVGAAGSTFTSPGWGGSESAAGSHTAGGSPALQLQSVGSVLGDDGSWLLGEASTGAIGALSPSAFLGSEQLALHDQQQQQRGEQLAAAAAESADASLRLTAAAAPAAAPAVSAAMPAPQVSRASAYFTSLPLTPGLPRGSFGFGQAGAAGAGGVAAAAAAAAQLGLLGSGGAPGSSDSGSAAAAAAFGAAAGNSPGMPPAAAFAACRSGASSSGRIVSAPLPNMPGPPQSGNGQGYGGSSFAGHSAQQQDPWQFHQSPYPPGSSKQGEAHWNFPRRPASFDCSRVSLSGRRRGSLELNMPWRKTLDAAIARAAAERGGAADAPASPALGARASSCGGCSTSARDASDSGLALGLAASEAEGVFGAATALAVAGGSWQHPRARRASQLELLMPLAEGDAEAAPGSPCGGCGPGSIGPGSMGSGAHGSSEDGDAASTTTSSRRSGDSGTGSSASGAEVAADHDLPGSTNIGGYIGGSDGLGLSRHSLESPTAAAAAAAEVAAAVKHHTLHQAASAPAMPTHSHHHQQQQGMEECDDASVATAQLSPLSRSAAQLQQSHGAASSSASLDRHVHRLQQEQVVVVTQSSESSEGDRCEIDDDASDASDEEDWCASSSSSTHATAKQQPASAFGPMHFQQHASGQGGLQSYQSSSSISSISSRASCGLYSGGCARQRGGGAMAGASRDLELFVRLNRARQTLDFAKRQAQAFAELDRAELSVWEALDLMDSLREVEAGLLAAATGSGGSGGSGSGGPDDAGGPPLTPDMSLKEHAFQVAELCRLSFPDKPWMALVGLLHGLGKLLSHPMWGSQPAWAVAGESFPVGCRFAPQISASEFFSANPDRRRRAYSTGLGVYTEHCGLRNVYMSWGGPEYLYMALVLNQTGLPEQALSLIRYQRCTALSRGAYRQLMTPEDVALLPLLADFQALLTYRRVPLPPGALRGAERAAHYDALIRTYLGEERLYW